MIRQRVKARLKRRRIRSKALLTIAAAYSTTRITDAVAHCYVGLRPFSGIGNVT